MKKLLASAPTLDAIRESVSDFYCGASVTLVPTSDDTWKVVGTYDSKTRDGMPGVRVVRKRGRYRFEMTP